MVWMIDSLPSFKKSIFLNNFTLKRATYINKNWIFNEKV
jgi:hypothetical protein